MPKDSPDAANPEAELDRLRRERDRALARHDAMAGFLEHLTDAVQTPLNGMLGLTKLIAATHLSLDQQRYVGALDRSGSDLLALVEEVRDLIRLERGRVRLDPTPVGLSDIIEATVRSLEPLAAERRIELLSRIEKSLDEKVRLDQERFSQLMTGLVGHVLRGSNADTVTVEARRASEARDRLTVMFRITGVGDTAALAGASGLFRRFSGGEGDTGRPEGLGLGLTICRQIVELMGGSIGMQSGDGSGSAIWFRLGFDRVEPSRRSGRKQREARRTAPSRAVSGLSLLVGDTNHLSRLMTGTLLRKAGHEVTEVSDGRALVKAVREGAFDAVLVDVALPGLSGIDAVRGIRRLAGRRGRTPVIALAADSGDDERNRLLAAGMSDCLVRPVDLDALSAALEDCTGQPVQVPGLNDCGADHLPSSPRRKQPREAEPRRSAT